MKYIDKTQTIQKRGEAISAFLKENGVKNFVGAWTYPDFSQAMALMVGNERGVEGYFGLLISIVDNISKNLNVDPKMLTTLLDKVDWNALGRK